MSLNADEQRVLFGIARGAIAAVFGGRDFEFLLPISENLARPTGVFVTLKLNRDLRGCIGKVMPVEPLYLGVANNALNAAFRDPRFLPLTRVEFDGVKIEISIMTLPEPVSDLESIVVGKHGLIVRRGRYGGLLLPQVPLEFGWDRDRFLCYTCLKAGLPPDSWKASDCRVEKFTAEVFAEMTVAP